jgi:two-component system probable response regulator PhcQ
MYRVLLVDDEPNILNALRRCLAAIDVRQLGGEALLFETFTSPEAAIERSDEQDFDLVISDYRMPSMNGVAFLSRLMEIQPAAPRMIISGFADRSAIIAAVNEVHLTRFLEKPWNDDELRQAVAAILGNKHRAVAKPAADDSLIERADDGGIVISQIDSADFAE